MASGETLVGWEGLTCYPPSSNYATFVVRNAHPAYNYDDTTQETRYFEGIVPSNYSGGDITVYIHFAAASATSGTGGWIIAFERIGDGAQDMDSDGFAADQTVTAVTVPGTSGNVKISSLTVTAGSATDSIAAGEKFRLKVSRDVANDTAVGDLQLTGVELREA